MGNNNHTSNNSGEVQHDSSVKTSNSVKTGNVKNSVVIGESNGKVIFDLSKIGVRSNSSVLSAVIGILSVLLLAYILSPISDQRPISPMNMDSPKNEEESPIMNSPIPKIGKDTTKQILSNISSREKNSHTSIKEGKKTETEKHEAEEKNEVEPDSTAQTSELTKPIDSDGQGPKKSYKTRIFVPYDKNGAKIFLDGKDLGIKAPAWIYIPEGLHQLKLEYTNLSYGEYYRYTDSISVSKDSTIIHARKYNFQKISK